MFSRLFVFIFILVSVITAQARTVPVWFARDLARRAQWLPRDVKTLGVEVVARQKLAALPVDVQQTLEAYQIPSWLVSLMPLGHGRDEEVIKQLRFLPELGGPEPTTLHSQRIEQLLIFAGAAQLPTPGDHTTGRSLGAEGCTAAMSKYVLAQLQLEDPQLAFPAALTISQSSSELIRLFTQLAAKGVVRVKRIPFSKLRAEDIPAGSLMIARKPGGAHSFGWTRVPRGWNWSDTAKIAIGNTGLQPFGERMILAQEYVTADAGEALHNEHGAINSRSLQIKNGAVNLADPRTNVYASQGSEFIVIEFR